MNVISLQASTVASWYIAVFIHLAVSSFQLAHALTQSAEPLPIGLDFIECEGNRFDPAWTAFKRKLPPRLSQGMSLGEPLASEAADLLDDVEAEDLAAKAAIFGSILRGETGSLEQLGGFCLYGAVTAYATIAIHLDHASGMAGPPPTAKSSIARALLLTAKKTVI